MAHPRLVVGIILALGALFLLNYFLTRGDPPNNQKPTASQTPDPGVLVRATDDTWLDELRKPRERVRLQLETSQEQSETTTIEVRTWGPLDPAQKDEVRSRLLMVIESNSRKLEKEGFDLGPEKYADIELTIATRKAQLFALEHDLYFTFDKGEGNKIWPAGTNDYAVIGSFAMKDGHPIDLVYVLDYKTFPELAARNSHYADALFVERSEDADEFNKLPFDERREFLESRKAGEYDKNSRAYQLFRQATTGVAWKVDTLRSTIRVLHRTERCP